MHQEGAGSAVAVAPAPAALATDRGRRPPAAARRAVRDGGRPETDRLAYLPGLDGLRAVAVTGVFLFHGGVAWMTGGYLAVSTFFTLSGFLITLLLLREHERRGAIGLGAFWERRIRRLLPAAALGVALAAAVTFAVGTGVQQRSFGGDGVATLLDVANWRFVIAGTSYSQLFSAPSALQHAWSLAIEAQFYWIYPLVAAAALKALGGSRRRFGVLLAVLAAASLALVRYGGFDHDRIYYGTDTRAAELLAGALLAVLIAGRRGGIAQWSSPARRVIGLGSLAAAVLLVGSWVVTPRDAAWLDRGGLGLYAAASAAVVLGASVPWTALSAVLAARPLVALGRISYGVYLFHWPILILLAPGRVEWPEAIRLLVAAVLTVGLATASYRLVELPIRRRQGTLGRPGLAWVAAGCAVVALVPTVAVARHAPSDDQKLDQALDQAAGTSVDDVDRLGPPPPDGSVAPITDPAGRVVPTTVAQGGPAPRAFTRPSRPLRIVVVGDSTALSLAPLLDDWGRREGIWIAASSAVTGCGVLRSAEAMNPYFTQPYSDCDRLMNGWPDLINRVRPDLVVLSTGFWEGTNRRFDGDDRWRVPGDPVYDAALRRDFGRALDLLGRTGAPVAWLDHPTEWFNEKSPWPLQNPQIFEPARLQRVDEVQQEVVAGRPGGRVAVVRTRDFFRDWPGGILDPSIRPDGLHIKGPGAVPLVEWMSPEILNLYWAATGQPG